MAKEIFTRHGPQAKDGDYVLVIHNPSMGAASGLIGKVYNGKAYTGYRYGYSREPKYYHRLQVECVVPAEWVSEERRAAIEEDIRVSTTPKPKKAVAR